MEKEIFESIEDIQKWAYEGLQSGLSERQLIDLLSKIEAQASQILICVDRV